MSPLIPAARLSLVASACLACLFAPHSARADLTNVPGMNSPQAAMAGAIMSVCPTLAQNQSTLTPVQLDLSNICTYMVVTSLEQQGQGTFDISLKISEDELRQGLQALAHEEVAAQGSNAVDTGAGGANRAVGARLFQLRQGSRGFNAGSLNLNLNGVRLAGSQLVTPERGGGASADAPGGRLGGFLNAGYQSGDKDATSREDAFDFDAWNLVGGVDYRFSDRLVGGLAFNYGKTDNQITSFPGGDADTKTLGLSLYGSFYQSDAFYLDGHLNYSNNDYDTRRRVFILSNNPAIASIDRNALGSTDGDQLSMGISAGYHIQRDALTITPYASLNYLDLDIDGYTESGAEGLDLQVDSQSLSSLQSAVGVQLAWAISTQSGVVVPQASLEWRHEFDYDSRAITARYAHDPFDLSTFSVPTNDPDENYFILGLGVSTVMRNGVSAFVNVETVLGHELVDSWGIVAGLRVEL